MISIHWFFTALRPVVSSFPLLSRLLTPITVLRSSAIVALTWTQRFTIASSSDSSLHAGRSSRLRVLSSPHRGRINNRKKRAHDLRRTCAKLCRKNGGDLEQIKFLLGHSSIQTTERYLGSEQDLAVAVNDNLGL